MKYKSPSQEGDLGEGNTLSLLAAKKIGVVKTTPKSFFVGQSIRFLTLSKRITSW